MLNLFTVANGQNMGEPPSYRSGYSSYSYYQSNSEHNNWVIMQLGNLYIHQSHRLNDLFTARATTCLKWSNNYGLKDKTGFLLANSVKT